MSRHQFHVATSFLPTVGFPGRDTKNPGCDLPHCNPCRDLKNDVAASNQLSPISATSRRYFSMSRPPLLPPMSRPQNDVTTWGLEKQVARAAPMSWARTGAVVHAAAPALCTCCLPVTTSKLGRDPVLEIGSSLSSLCLAQIFFFLFQNFQ